MSICSFASFPSQRIFTHLSDYLSIYIHRTKLVTNIGQLLIIDIMQTNWILQLIFIFRIAIVVDWSNNVSKYHITIPVTVSSIEPMISTQTTNLIIKEFNFGSVSWLSGQMYQTNGIVSLQLDIKLRGFTQRKCFSWTKEWNYFPYMFHTKEHILWIFRREDTWM